MPTTSNFGWTTPADTDLVKDGAAAIRTLGNGIDTSFLDLKGGTTDQVLAKNSGTDLDFKWVAQDDSNAIQNAIVDAKGDLISATAADTPARLGVGANDTVLTADSSTATGLKWAAPAAGGMTLLASGTITTTVNLTSINQTYNELWLYVDDFGAASANELKFRFNNDSNTVYSVLRISGANTQFTSEMRNADNSFIVVANDNEPNAADAHCVLRVPNYTCGAFKLASSISYSVLDFNNENGIRSATCAYRSATAISEINIIGVTAGNYKLYGVK
jgi:hypothetical protein